jgi:hypothetical protein
MLASTTPATVEVATRANVALDPTANAMLASTASTGIIALATPATVEAAPTANVALQLATVEAAPTANVALQLEPTANVVLGPTANVALAPTGDDVTAARSRERQRSRGRAPRGRGRQSWTIGPSLAAPPTADGAVAVETPSSELAAVSQRGQGCGRRGRGARCHRGNTIIIKVCICSCVVQSLSFLKPPYHF